MDDLKKENENLREQNARLVKALRYALSHIAHLKSAQIAVMHIEDVLKGKA